MHGETVKFISSVCFPEKTTHASITYLIYLFIIFSADVVQRDALQLLGVRGWRRRAENRDEWRHALRKAKARKGL
jgi:hypothetical protein